MTLWTHNPTEGVVIGLVTKTPFPLDWMKQLTVVTFIQDSHKKIWRVRAGNEIAGQLLDCKVGERVKLTGVRGDLRPGAWNNAKHQIVPKKIERKS